MIARIVVVLAVIGSLGAGSLSAQGPQSSERNSDTKQSAAVSSSQGREAAEFVAVLSMDMLILPGTLDHLKDTIAIAHEEGARALVIQLDTPGGMLQTSQEMIQVMFASPIPVIVYVAPSGGTATSAGVFITLAAHIAAMAPGTTIGAATPVQSDGKDIEGDMKAKAENITLAMVRSIAERRGRNISWAEKAVKEAASLTEAEALSQGVIDIVAEDIPSLLAQIKGKEVQLVDKKVTLEDLSSLPLRTYDLSFRNEALNLLANPSVVALLWLAATTGISIELYNPGLIFPGVIGVISLILALAVSQVIPVNQAAIALLALGGLLIGAELYTGTILLGILGITALVLGAVYIVDMEQALGLRVAYEIIIPTAIVFGGALLAVSIAAYRAARRPIVTGAEGLVGLQGTVIDPVSLNGKVYLNGEYWKACTPSGILEKGEAVEVLGVKPGLVLEVQRVKKES